MKVLNFLLRMVFGAIGIQIINAILISQNISVFVGLNILTLLTVGSLGISGVGNWLYNLTQDRLIFPGWCRRRHSQHLRFESNRISKLENDSRRRSSLTAKLQLFFEGGLR